MALLEISAFYLWNETVLWRVGERGKQKTSVTFQLISFCAEMMC